ncbi:hypothetical protein [Rubritalea tangerina]|uniref:hypothetical protein n=1 Tax=Rubritalea tangerina TaxID=430798 RepID=UPI00360F4AD3
MTFYKIIRFTLKSRSANFTRLNHTPFVYSESRDGIIHHRYRLGSAHLPKKSKFPVAKSQTSP